MFIYKILRKTNVYYLNFGAKYLEKYRLFDILLFKLFYLFFGVEYVGEVFYGYFGTPCINRISSVSREDIARLISYCTRIWKFIWCEKYKQPTRMSVENCNPLFTIRQTSSGRINIH